MEIIQQPLTQRQRNELEGVVALSSVMVRATFFLLFVASVGVNLRWLQHQFWHGLPLWLAPTILIALWLYRYAERWTGGAQLRRQVREDLASGNASVTVLEPDAVQEVEEMEDEGLSFVVNDVDGGVYLLTGQEISRYKSAGFPWRRIGVVHAPASGKFLGLKKMGDPIAPAAVRPAFDFEQARQLGCHGKSFSELNSEQRELLDELWS